MSSTPTAYTRTTLATYMRDGVLLTLATTLALTDPSHYEEPLNSVELSLGKPIPDSTDLPLVRQYAKVAALDMARTAAATDYEYSTGGTTGAAASYKRNQVFDQVSKLLSAAQAELREMLVARIRARNEARKAAGSYGVPTKARW